MSSNVQADAVGLATPVDAAAHRATQHAAFRWVQLVLGIACMALVANLQYGWTLFVNPIAAKHHWSLADIQWAFSIFVFVETWLVPVEGWLVDRFGPRPVVALGALFAGAGWLIDALAGTLTELYAAAVIAGLGAGCVYGTCVGNAVKWFPDRRGLAAGLTAAGFGVGSVFTIVPIGNMIDASGYEHAFRFFGVFQGLCILVLSIFLVRPVPPKGVVARPCIVQALGDYTIWQMLRTPVFWVTYLLFVAVAAGGLIATAQISPIAKDFGLSKLPVDLLGLATLPLLTFVVSVDQLANGFTRPLCGFISDRIGRENTMGVVFLGEGLALLGMMRYGHDPVAFATFAALIFLFWGEIFSIFPALVADTFGAKYAAGNAGAMYTAKGLASFAVPVSAWLASGGDWNKVFIFSAAIAIAAAIFAKFVLAPMRRRYIHYVNTQGFH